MSDARLIGMALAALCLIAIVGALTGCAGFTVAPSGRVYFN